MRGSATSMAMGVGSERVPLPRRGLSFYWRDAGEAEEGASYRGQEE